MKSSRVVLDERDRDESLLARQSLDRLESRPGASATSNQLPAGYHPTLSRELRWMLDEPNDDNSGEELSVFDRAAEEGEEVFGHYWDANRPGGSGTERLYRLDDQFYYVSEDFEPGGPYA